jgi:VanZ family protein
VVPRQSPSNPIAADRRPEFLVRLGVGLPCTPQDVEQAYLEKVKLAHPDRGGSQQDFLELQSAYGRAKEYAKFQASRRNWLAEAVERYAAQQELIAEITARGGTVAVAQLDWLAGEIGEDFAQVLETIDSVTLSGPKFNDATIDELVRRQDVLGQLHRLDLSGANVTDAGAAKLAAFAYLHRLDMTGTKVGNASLKTFAALRSLERLNVAGTRVNRLGRFWLRVARPDLEITRQRRAATRGFRAHVPALAIICTIYLLAMATATHVPLTGVRLPEWRLIPIDKLFHFTAYAGLAFLLSTLAAAIWTGTEGKPWRHVARYAAVLPVVAVYGALDEITQPAVGRTADRLDWTADVAGAATGLAVFFAVRALLKMQARRRWALRSRQQISLIG